MHKFKITTGKSGQFTAKFVYNAETLIWSETYKSRTSARNCIASVKKNAPAAAVVDISDGESGKGYRFEVVEAKGGQHFVRFVARNGQVLMRSETYAAKASALNCIASVKKNGPGASTETETA